MRPITDLERRVAPFEVVSDYQPSGDQPAAIEEISKRIRGGEQDVVLLGATGTGKTATVAWVAEQLQVGWHVDGFWSAFWGALIVSVVSFVLNSSFLSRSEVNR